MIKFKKLLCAVTAICMLLTVGCSNSKKTANVNALPSVLDGNFAYTIVRATDAGEEVTDLVKDLRTKIKKIFNVKPKTVIDTVEADSDDSYEIVIGNTNRKATETAKKRLSDNRENYGYDFIIKVCGKKIVIYSNNTTMLCKAIEYFIDTYCADEKSWEKLNSDTEDLYEAPIEKNEHKLGKNRLKDYTLVTIRDMEYIYGKDVYAINDYFMEKTGMALNTTDDRHDPVSLEIQIGDVNRPESKEISVTGNNWIIKMVGEKLVIKGGNGLALSAAVEKFYNMITEAEEKKAALELPENYELSGTYEDNNGYKLVWGDEFNQKALDPYWWVEYAQNRYGDTSKSSLGGTVFKKSTTNVKMTGDGCATLFCNRVGNDFYVSSMSTFDTMLMRYGIIEIRAKFPVSPANCAYWLNGATLGSSVMTEYDIIENFGKTETFASNLHRWWGLKDKAGTSAHTSLDVKEFTDLKKFTFKDDFDTGLDQNFHTYTMDWDSERINFAVDGKVYFSYNLDEYDNPDSRMLPVYLILSCGMGGTDYGIAATEKDIDYAEFKVDYVRLYQRGDNDSLLYTRKDNNIPNWNGREIKYVNYASRQNQQ